MVFASSVGEYVGLKERGATVEFWGADDRLVGAARAEGLHVALVGASTSK